MKLATAEQMRQIDRRASEEWGIPGLVLMENAGSAVARAAESRWQASGEPGPVVLLCGPGNNGGDGLVAARHLHNRDLPVQVFLLAAADRLRGDAATNYALARRFGVPLVEQPSPAALRRALSGAGLVVDALLGTGLSGPIRGEIGRALGLLEDCLAPVLAVDIPSGVNSETGAIMGVAAPADLTLTLGLGKPGLYCYPGRAYCGEIEVVDLSLPRELLESSDLQTELVTPGLAAACLPVRGPAMHKGDAGRLLIVSGSRGMTGAATLAASAAVRAGAGLVYLAAPQSLAPVLEVKCTEPITLPQPETEAGTLARAALPGLLAHAESCDAVLLGPGLGRHPETAALVAQLVAQLRCPLVVDADGLNALAGDLTPLRRRRRPTVLTPHPGELARLTGRSGEEIQADRLAAGRSAAADLDCVVLLKGAGTVCVEPGGEALLNPTGNDGLASGGTGDVLAGVLGAFLAGGAPPAAAAAAAAYYHGLAADLYAAEYAARSLAAGDLLDYLPRALAEAEQV
ncbi:MAG TPA: NAD(P)H-hydrate dehydratase [Armatimonadota bacterium]|jgi:NAD(P)H-hydrate epimerase